MSFPTTRRQSMGRLTEVWTIMTTESVSRACPIGHALNCADGGVLTLCPPRRFSISCPLLEWCVSRMQATGRLSAVCQVTRGATGCRRHVKAFQAAHAVIRSSAPGCELSASLVPGRLPARSNGKSSSRRTTGGSDDICPRRQPRTADNRRTAGQQCSVDVTFE